MSAPTQGKDETMSEQKRFEDQDLRKVVFKDCRMAGAGFDDVDLSETVFSNANLHGARFTNVNLTGVEIEDANIDGLKIFGHDIHALIRAELARRRAG